MNNLITSIIKNLFSLFGLVVYTKKGKERLQDIQLNWLRDFKPLTVIDIGANTGEYAHFARSLYPDALIYSFEPLEECYLALKSSMKGDEKFKAFNCALGDASGTLDMYRNDFSPSSSILEMVELHKDVMPITRSSKQVQIQIKKLDDIMDELQIKPPVLIKLDVQGYEDKVILGGKNLFEKANFVLSELTFVELYKGQAMFDNVYELLTSMGYKFRGIVPQGFLVDPKNGMPLQADGYFIRDTF